MFPTVILSSPKFDFAGIVTADSLDAFKKKACGCFVAGLRRGLRGQEPALVESGAVYVYNFHLPVSPGLFVHHTP